MSFFFHITLRRKNFSTHSRTRLSTSRSASEHASDAFLNVSYADHACAFFSLSCRGGGAPWSVFRTEIDFFLLALDATLHLAPHPLDVVRQVRTALDFFPPLRAVVKHPPVMPRTFRAREDVPQRFEPRVEHGPTFGSVVFGAPKHQIPHVWPPPPRRCGDVVRFAPHCEIGDGPVGEVVSGTGVWSTARQAKQFAERRREIAHGPAVFGRRSVRVFGDHDRHRVSHYGVWRRLHWKQALNVCFFFN